MKKYASLKDRFLLLLLTAVAFSCVNPEKTHAEVASSITGTYAFPDFVSDSDGCFMALTRAKSKAIEDACGTTTSGGSSRFRNEEIDSLDLFYFEMVGGSVVGSEILERNITTLYTGSSLDIYKECTVHANITVECDKGERDPHFAPNLQNNVSINSMVFRNGETMRLTISPDSDMYLYVLQFSPYAHNQKSVYLIFPNDIEKNNHLRKGATVNIPSANYEDTYKLDVLLPEGKARAAEELMFVASKSELTFPNTMKVETFHRLLSGVSLDQRREAMIPYQIIGNR